ncbi:hypothetical protein SCYAM73S_05652 [Streptomyces cyaneofuscatus]
MSETPVGLPAAPSADTVGTRPLHRLQASEATDGSIGKVDKHSDDVTSSYLVVDTGVWIFGKHVLLPAGTVSRIDTDDQKVYIDLTKEQIKDAPEFDKDKHVGDADFHRTTGEYYGRHRRV